MSLFSIKLKTKNGNDVHKKETVSVFFRLKYSKGLKTTAEYTYRIIHSHGVVDPQTVLEIKNSKNVESVEDLTLKVLLNLCHVIAKISSLYNIDPDFILFLSPDFGNKNDSWQFLQDVFKRPKFEKTDEKGVKKTYAQKVTNLKEVNWLEDFTSDYHTTWTSNYCKKKGIKKEELDMLKEFGDRNSSTCIMSIDPTRDSKKYAKSIHVCNMLKDRIDRNLQITELVKDLDKFIEDAKT